MGLMKGVYFIIFLVVSFFGFIFFIVGFPLLKGGTTSAVSEIPNHTANTTAWTGFSASLNWTPMAAGFILIALFLWAGFQFLRKKSQ